MMDSKHKLISGVWGSDLYYQMAKEGSFDLNHPGLIILKELSQSCERILDLGCGEGSRLNILVKGRKKGTGVDISKTAINMAKKAYPKLNFIKSDLEKIPLSDEKFDLIYSAYVLEHLSSPIKVLSEAIRLLSKDGFLILIAPNYGAPNRCSPPYTGSRVKKLIIGFLNDFLHFSDSIRNWTKVEPLMGEYFVDSDTTIEPYIRSLMNFLTSKGLKIQMFTSCWSEELNNVKPHQVVFRFLGKLGLYPFSMWGPHLVVVAKKEYE